MALFSVNTHRYDPYRNFKFQLAWDGRVVAGVSKISALKRTTEVVEHRDGGDMSSPRLSPGTTSYEPITLERGLSHDTEFEEWANMVFNIAGDGGVSLKGYRKDILIQMMNLQGTIVKSFQIYGCWVSEYQAVSELDANGTSVAIEKITIQHQGWARDKDVAEPAET